MYLGTIRFIITNEQTARNFEYTLTQKGYRVKVTLGNFKSSIGYLDVDVQEKWHIDEVLQIAEEYKR